MRSMHCAVVSIVFSQLLPSSSDVRDVYRWVQASLGRRGLLSGRVVCREDRLLRLLADVHLEVARDSLLLGHCGGCAGLFVWRRVLVDGERRALVSGSARSSSSLGGVQVQSSVGQVAAAGGLARKDYARRRGRMRAAQLRDRFPLPATAVVEDWDCWIGLDVCFTCAGEW